MMMTPNFPVVGMVMMVLSLILSASVPARAFRRGPFRKSSLTSQGIVATPANPRPFQASAAAATPVGGHHHHPPAASSLAQAPTLRGDGRRLTSRPHLAAMLQEWAALKQPAAASPAPGPAAVVAAVGNLTNGTNGTNGTNMTSGPPPPEKEETRKMVVRRPGPPQDDLKTNESFCLKDYWNYTVNFTNPNRTLPPAFIGEFGQALYVDPEPNVTMRQLLQRNVSCTIGPEDHWRPPLVPPPPYPPPTCGLFGSAYEKTYLAWDPNVEALMNLSVPYATTVKVHVGDDKLYNKPRVKTYQPAVAMSDNPKLGPEFNATMEMSEVDHDCREVNKNYLGYFTFTCVATHSDDPFSEQEFDAEWGIGTLVVEEANSTDNRPGLENGTFTPDKCIPDVYPPVLESIEMGVFPNDTQYIWYGEGYPGSWIEEYPTRLPTLWAPWRCPTCTMRNPAYEEIPTPFLCPQKPNGTNGTNGTNASSAAVTADTDDEDTDAFLQDDADYADYEYDAYYGDDYGDFGNGTNWTGCVDELPPKGPDYRPEFLMTYGEKDGWKQVGPIRSEWKWQGGFKLRHWEQERTNTTGPEKPPWSNRVLLKPLPPGIPEWVQIVNPWDGMLLRFDECVQPSQDWKMIPVTFTPLNPLPNHANEMKPRGYRGTPVSVKLLDTSAVTGYCGNWTIRPPVPLITKNRGQMYEVSIPKGAFTDMVDPPNPMTHGLLFNITVRDVYDPHVQNNFMDGGAFFPKAYHEGRYPWHNITIKFDEQVMLNPHKDKSEYKIKLNPRDDKYETLVIPFGPEQGEANLIDVGVEDAMVTHLHINPFGHDEFKHLEIGARYHVEIELAVLVDIFGNPLHGLSTCPKDCMKGPRSTGPGGTYPGDDGKLPEESFPKNINPGGWFTPCCEGNYYFTIADEEMMDMRKKILFLREWALRRVKDTVEMFHDTFENEGSINTLGWIHGFAGFRALLASWSIGEAKKILDDPLGLPTKLDLQNVINELNNDKMEPWGRPFSDPDVCSDFATHVLPGRMTCGPAADKRAIGYDTLNQAGIFYFRNGCFCQSQFIAGCPLASGMGAQWPTYRDFGFNTYEEKVVDTGVGPHTENALCWYWSTPDHPEWGYIGTPDNYYHGGDQTAQWNCARPRHPGENCTRLPCSEFGQCTTFYIDQWDIPDTKKKYWSRASAYRPTTAAAAAE